MSEDFELPAVTRRIVGIHRQAASSVLTLECKHQVPALPYRSYRSGDMHICNRCGAKEMAALLAKAKTDSDT